MAGSEEGRPSASYVLLAFPHADRLFRRAALDEVDGAGPPPARPTWMRLRVRYPDAELHLQRAVVIGDRRTDTWFAFREGRTRPSCPSDEWWDLPGTASATLHGSGRLTHRSRAFQLLFDSHRPGWSGSVADLMPPALAEEVLMEPARSEWPASVTSSAVFRARAGETNMEFHITWHAHGRDRHRFAARTFNDREAAHRRQAIARSGLGVLPSDRLRETLRGSRVRELAQGERLQESIMGTPWAALVTCGVARLYVTGDGVEPTLLHASHGALVGSHIGPDDPSLVIGLQALTPCRVMHLDARRVTTMMRTDAAFAAAIAAEGRSTLRALIDTYAIRSAASLTRRLARDLVAIAELHGQGGFVPLTEQQLADGLGSIRESVARTIGELRRRGLLATTRYGILLLDPVALAQAGRATPGGSASDPL